jgi:hypothetical protein
MADVWHSSGIRPDSRPPKARFAKGRESTRIRGRGRRGRECRAGQSLWLDCAMLFERPLCRHAGLRLRGRSRSFRATRVTRRSGLGAQLRTRPGAKGSSVSAAGAGWRNRRGWRCQRRWPDSPLTLAGMRNYTSRKNVKETHRASREAGLEKHIILFEYRSARAARLLPLLAISGMVWASGSSTASDKPRVTKS